MLNKNKVLLKNISVPFFYAILLLLAAGPVYGRLPLLAIPALAVAFYAFIAAAKQDSLSRYTAAVTLAAEPYLLAVSALLSTEALVINAGPAVAGMLAAYSTLRRVRGVRPLGVLVAGVAWSIVAGFMYGMFLQGLAAAIPLLAAAAIARVYRERGDAIAVAGCLFSPVALLAGGDPVNALVVAAVLAYGLVSMAMTKSVWV